MGGHRTQWLVAFASFYYMWVRSRFFARGAFMRDAALRHAVDTSDRLRSIEAAKARVL